MTSLAHLAIAHVRYINMLIWLRGFQVIIFLKFLLSLNSQKRLGYKENNTKYGSLSWKPRSRVGILIYRTWTTGKNYKVSVALIYLIHNRASLTILPLLTEIEKTMIVSVHTHEVISKLKGNHETKLKPLNVILIHSSIALFRVNFSFCITM